MNKKIIFILSMVLCFTGWSSSAQEQIRIAVIDMNQVFEKYYKTQIHQSKLKKQAEIFQNYANELVQSRNNLQREFIALRNDSQNMAYSDAERENRRLNAQDKYQQVLAKEREIKEYNREKQAQLRDEYDKFRNMILADIHKAVTTKCMAEGYTLVLDKSGRSMNNVSLVIFSAARLDITKSIIKILNMGQPKTAVSK